MASRERARGRALPGAGVGGRPSTPPVMELRTYTGLRLGAIGVIAILALSLTREYHAAGGCFRESISAYYYTPVQSVFVGAVLTLGFVMIVLWGRTAFENGALNLAGLVAPVVAFVPTLDANLCAPSAADGRTAGASDRTAALISAGRYAIDNNMEAYLVVTGVVLLAMLGLGVLAQVWTKWEIVADRPASYWWPLAIATVLWAAASYGFWQRRDWFYENAHAWAARTLFFFIVLVVVNIGAQKWRGEGTPDRAEHTRYWAVTYWALAAVMTLGAVAAFVVAEHIGEAAAARRTYFVEAWMIFWLAAFWALQTWDRWKDGAPTRTSAANR